MRAFDLALGLRVIRCATDMIHLPVFRPVLPKCDLRRCRRAGAACARPSPDRILKPAAPGPARQSDPACPHRHAELPHDGESGCIPRCVATTVSGATPPSQLLRKFASYLRPGSGDPLGNRAWGRGPAMMILPGIALILLPQSLCRGRKGAGLRARWPECAALPRRSRQHARRRERPRRWPRRPLRHKVPSPQDRRSWCGGGNPY